MNILEIEQIIISKLKEKIDANIIPFPEKASEFKPTHPKASILVVFSGSNFSPPQTTDMVVQERKIVFDIVVVSRNLRGHQGCYDYLEQIKYALTGKVEGMFFYPVSEELVSEESGVWQYVVRFTTTIPFIQQQQDSYPRIRRITTDNTLYEETIQTGG